MMIKAYRCSHSGKFLPADYIKEWGRKYGVGMGPVAVSECLDTDYSMPVAESSDPTRTMHPVGNTFAQIDFVMVDEAEYEANQLILMKDDPTMAKRAKLLRDIQATKPNSKIKKEVI